MDIYLITETGARPVALDAIGRTLEQGTGVVWIDFGHDEHDGERLLTDLIQAQPEDVEDCHTRMPVPKLHAYRDHYFSAINGLARGTDERLYFQPLKIFFNPKLLITVMGPTSASVTPEAVRGDLLLVRDRLAAPEVAADVSLRAGHRDQVPDPAQPGGARHGRRHACGRAGEERDEHRPGAGRDGAG